MVDKKGKKVHYQSIQKLSQGRRKMNVLSKIIRNGHFVWCPLERTLAQHGCKRCKGRLYLTAMLLAVVTAFIEFWGSSQTGSLSLGSDAWHVVFDSLGYFIGAVDALLVARFIKDRNDTLRIKRVLEIVIAVFIILAATIILAESLGRMQARSIPDIRHNGLLFSVALFGLGVNVLLLFVFRLFAVGHSHGTNRNGHNQSDKILSANIWHTLGDTVSSLLVIANSIIFSLTSQPQWHYLDLVVSAIIAFFLLYQGIRTMWQ